MQSLYLARFCGGQNGGQNENGLARKSCRICAEFPNNNNNELFLACFSCRASPQGAKGAFFQDFSFRFFLCKKAFCPFCPPFCPPIFDCKLLIYIGFIFAGGKRGIFFSVHLRFSNILFSLQIVRRKKKYMIFIRN